MLYTRWLRRDRTTPPATSIMSQKTRTMWKDNSGVSIFHKGGVYHASAEAVRMTKKSLAAVTVEDLKKTGLGLVRGNYPGTYRFVLIDEDAVSWNP